MRRWSRSVAPRAGRRVIARPSVRGLLGGPEPFESIQQALAREHCDDVIISTLPKRRSEFLRRDLPGRVEELGIPVMVITQPAEKRIGLAEIASAEGRTGLEATTPRSTARLAATARTHRKATTCRKRRKRHFLVAAWRSRERTPASRSVATLGSMALGVKGSRPIVVDGVAYRWKVRRKPSYGQLLGDSNLVFAVELSDVVSGQVLVVDTGRAPPRRCSSRRDRCGDASARRHGNQVGSRGRLDPGRSREPILAVLLARADASIRRQTPL